MKAKKQVNVYDMAYIAIFVVLIIICSWITIPLGTIPITMQTFAIFLAVGVLGGKRAGLAVLIYLLMGSIGFPVFSGFRAGAGILAGPTGGYLLGFVPALLIMWLLEKMFGKGSKVLIIGMLSALLVCYSFGTFWFMILYAENAGTIGVKGILFLCVLPFVIPDMIKAGLAFVITKRLRKVLPH